MLNAHRPSRTLPSWSCLPFPLILLLSLTFHLLEFLFSGVFRRVEAHFAAVVAKVAAEEAERERSEAARWSPFAPQRSSSSPAGPSSPWMHDLSPLPALPPSAFAVPSTFMETGVIALPTPSQVWCHGKILHVAELHKRVWDIEWQGVAMIVEGGKDVQADEAAWTEQIRISTGLPVPKVYGIRYRDEETFIYFEKLPGKVLERGISSLYLQGYLHILHSFEAPAGTSIGGFAGKNLGAVDPFLQSPPSPPLKTVSQLCDWLRARYLSQNDAATATWDNEVTPFLSTSDRLSLSMGT
ncbi:hypothetical protein JCM6882_006050 [Rhodosporidiobolus microsporus]